MNSEYIPLLGEPADPKSLRIPKAQALVELLTSAVPYPFVKFIECRIFDGASQVSGENIHQEVIVLDVEVEVPQQPIHNIHPIERISVVFREDDRFIPEVLALRDDFPIDVPHLNIHFVERPASLCLYDIPWEEEKIRWTAGKFLERIRTWLALTAEGKLHAPDQPLEPLLLGLEAAIILPNYLLQREVAVPEKLYCYRTGGHESEHTTVVVADREPHQNDGQPSQFLVLPLGITETVTHGMIRWRPGNIKALHDFLQVANFDLLGALRRKLRELQTDASALGLIPIFVIIIPKRRQEDSEAEAFDTWAFLADMPLSQIGEEIGIFAKHGSHEGLILGDQFDSASNGEKIPIELMRPYFRFDRTIAQISNGIYPVDNDIQVAAIGMGALGSQLFDNLIRAGFGRWSLIDHDTLMPHNLARHSLHSDFVGLPKAFAISGLASRLIGEPDMSVGIVTNILRPGKNKEKLDGALASATVLLDTSASVAVARAIARDHKEVAARRISAFLSPSGSDLIVLAEDVGRTTRLDSLEMQYYRAVAFQRTLDRHLTPPQGQQRYGWSCRDLSAVLSQETVALHAAIAARAIRKIHAIPAEPALRIWRTNAELEVGNISVPAFPTIESTIEGANWTICTDTYFMDKVRRLRAAAAGNETGGVILGSIDTQRRIIYAVDVLPPPPDSEESPSSFVRGAEGLQLELARIREATAGWLEYIGEWHSHPPGCSAAYSEKDKALFGWLSEHLAYEGHPPVMLIVGENERWYVETLAENPNEETT